MANNRIIVQPGQSAGAILGTYDIFGTNTGVESVTVFDGTTAYFQGDFARGGDVIRLTDVAGDFTAVLSGSNVVLTSVSDNITVYIPVGTVGVKVVFENAAGQMTDERTLVFNGTNVVLGAQTINFAPAALVGGDAGNNPTTTVLTAGQDVLTGTASADTYLAQNNTLNAGDIINGGAGADQLRVFTDQSVVVTNYAGFELSNIETLDLTNDSSKAISFDLSGSIGLTTLINRNSTQAVAFNQLTALANLVVNNLTDPAAANTTVQFQDQVVAGANDTIGVSLVNSSAASIVVGSLSDANGGIETINLDVTGRNSVLTSLDADITTLGLTGNRNLTITNALNPTIRTISGADFAGNANISVAGATGGVTVNLGSGADTIVGSSNADTINVRGGNNSVTAGDGNDSVTAADGNNVIDVGNGNDSVTVGNGNNSIVAGEGDNLVVAGGGANTITSGAGTDNITVGNGANNINAGNGDNTVNIGTGANTVTTGSGNDNVLGGGGNNAISTGDGQDSIVVGGGNDTVNAGAGNDIVFAGEGNNVIDAGTGSDVVVTGGGADQITIGSGNDSVSANSGNDTIIGGADFDAQGTVVLDGNGNPVLDGNGNLTYTANGGDSIDAGAGRDTLSINAGSNDANFRFVSGVEVLNITSAGTTTLSTLAQAAGIDQIDAKNAGADVVNAGTFTRGLTVNLTAGDDTVVTGSGNDSFTVGDLTDADALNAGSGIDTLNLDADTTLVAPQFTGFETINLGSRRNEDAVDGHVYNLTLSNANAPNPNVAGAGTLAIDGSALAADTDGTGPLIAETLTLNAAAVSAYRLNVTGGAAADTITSGTGGATINGGGGNDTIVLTGGTNVVDGGTGDDNITLGSGTADTISGGDGNDTFIAVSANLAAGDVISGGAGANTLRVTGNTTDAQYTGVTQVQTLSFVGATTSTIGAEAQEGGIRTVNLDNSASTLNASAYTSGANLTVNGGTGNDTITTGAGDDSVSAGDGNDNITTGAGNDLINGGNGNDVISAGTGNDTVVMGAGADSISLGTGSNLVRVTSDATGANLDFADTITGGSDDDTILLVNTITNTDSGAVTAGINLDNVTGVETVRVAGDGGSSNITFTGGNVTTLNSITVDAQAMTAANNQSTTVTLAAGQTDADFFFNVLGGSGRDVFVKLNTGVNNNIVFNAGAGDDEARFASGQDLGSTSFLQGGAGTDSIVLLGGAVSDDDFLSVSSFERLAASGAGLVAQLGASARASGLTTIDADAGNFNDNIIVDAKFTGPLTVTLGQGADVFNAGNSTAAITFNVDNQQINSLDTLIGGQSASDVVNVRAGDVFADFSNSSGIERYNVVEVGDNSIGLAFSDNSFAGIASNTIIIDGTALDDTPDPEGSLVVVANATTGRFDVRGGTGDDVVLTGSGADTIVTGSGNDYIDAQGGANTVNAGTGNDTIVSGSGNDSIVAGDGNDEIVAGDGNNNVAMGAGNDVAFTGAGNDVITDDGGDNTVSSGAGNDSVTVTTGNNNVDLGAGNDTVVGGNGNNVIRAGLGDDSVTLGNGNNVVFAGAGNDVVAVGNGANTITGGQGADLITLGSGANTIRFLQATDSYGLAATRDTIVGFNSNDTITLETNVLGVGVTSINFVGDARDAQEVQLGINGRANDGKADAIYDVSTGRLLIDVNDDGLFDARDLAISFQTAGGANAPAGTFSQGQFQVVDSVAPVALGVDLLAASDSGVSNSDDLTNISPVTVRVSFDNSSVDGSAAIAGNTLTLTNAANNATVTRTLTAGDIANGYYDFSIALANPGAAAAGSVNTLSATLQDAVGNNSSVSLGVRFDDARPTIAIGDFDGADAFLNDAEDNSVVISGTASADAAGRTVTVTVTDNVNPAVTGTATVDGFGNWSTAGLDLSGLNNGALTVSASVVDQAGNASLAATGTLSTTHDKVLPTVTITDDEAGVANIAGGNVIYTFTFSEDVTGFDASDVTVTNGSKGLFTAVSPTVYTLAVTPTAQFEGNMTVSVAAGVAIDAAANPNLASAQSTQAVDTIAPTILISEPVMGDNRINDAEDSVVVVGGTSTNAQAGRTVTVTFTRGGDTATATATVNADGTWATATVDLNAVFGLSAELGDTVTISAALSDAAGNAAVVDTATVSYDNNAPNTAFTYGSLEQEANVAPGSNKGDTVNDRVTNVNPADVTFTYDIDLTPGDVLQANLGGVWTNVPTANINTGTKTVTLVDAVLAAGNTTFDLRVVDAAGNVGPASPATIVTLDTTAPSVGAVTWTSVTEESNATNSGDTDATDGRTNQATVDVVFSYAGTDLGVGERFQYSVDGGSLWVDIAAGNVDATANKVTVAGISVTGSPTVAVRTIDAAGNETATLASKTITYDNTVPGMTAVTFVSVTEDSDDPTANNVTNQATATLTFSYTGTDLGTGERLQYTTDGGTTWLEGTFSVDAAKDTITLSGINVTGSPTIGLRAIDVAGNQTASLGSKAIVYDNADPTVAAVKYDNTTDTLTLTGTGFATNGNVVVDAAKIGWDVDGDGSVDFSLPNAAAGTTVTVVNDTTITLALTKTAAAGLEGLTSFAGLVEDKVVIATNALIDNAGNQNAAGSLFINLDLDGTDDANNIFGGQLADTLDGGLGADTLTGRAGIDVLNGGFGNDLLWGGAGNDTIDAGDGDDTVVVIGTHVAGTYDAALTAQMGFAVTTDGSAGYSASGSKETITFGAGYDTLEIYGTVNLADLTLVDLPERVNMNSTLRLTTAQLNQLRVIDFQGNTSHTIVLTDQTSDANAVAAFKSWANGVGQNVLFSDGISGTTIVIDSGATDANSGTSYAGPTAISGLLGGLSDELVTVPVISTTFNVGIDKNSAIDAGLGLKATVTLNGTAPPNSTVDLAVENQINNFEASNGASNDKLDFSDVTNKPADGLERTGGFNGPVEAFLFETAQDKGKFTSDVGTSLIDGKIAVVKVATDAAAQLTSTVFDMFNDTDGATRGDDQLFTVGTSKNGWVMVGADGTNKAYLYFVTDANANGAIDSNEVYAVGTLNLVTGQDIDDFHVGNFIFA